MFQALKCRIVDDAQMHKADWHKTKASFQVGSKQSMQKCYLTQFVVETNGDKKSDPVKI